MRCFLLVLVVFSFLWADTEQTEQTVADMVLRNGVICTMNPAMPEAQALAISGGRILAVFQRDEDTRSRIGRKTKVIDLQGAFVTPGIIDAHVHFDQAGGLIRDVNLMTVADDNGLRREITRVAGILEKGEWITEGLWGAYEQWSLGAAGSPDKAARKRWRPQRRLIDAITPDNPCLLSRFDQQEWLANTAALRIAGLLDGGEGMEMDETGKPTGIVFKPSPSFEKLWASRQAKSAKRLLDENRAALKALREAGIVEIHDIAKPDQVDRFIALQQMGELTCRVWLRPDLSLGSALGKKGLTMGMNPATGKPDGWLRYGALKGYIDGIMGTHGALFFEPYQDQPENRGHWRVHTSDDPQFRTGNMEKMAGLIREGLQWGFVPNVHAIGDRGVAEMLDLFERFREERKGNLSGFRVIHAQVIRPVDFPRFKKLGVIAEVNPYHISDDMRWMEERIGHERCRGAYAFRSLIDNGAILSFGSDWPGTSAAEYHMHPRYLIYAAVTRRTLAGQPARGWFPEQRITVMESLAAYTQNNALAALEEDIRGTLEPGKLADITVFDRNLLKIPPEEILKTEVLYTIVGGKLVFEKK